MEWREKMNKLGTKTLKIILFIGVFSYLQYHDIKGDAFTINSVTAGIFMASAAYLLASLFGIVLNFTMNYLIAIVGTGALALFLAFKLDEVIAATPLTEELAAIILGTFALLCLIRDIIAIKRSLTTPKKEKESTSAIAGVDNDPNISMRINLKSNAQSVLNLSNLLEKQWGRKPTYEEVMDYIDHLGIPEDDTENV